jgi:hypothetical protein
MKSYRQIHSLVKVLYYTEALEYNRIVSVAMVHVEPTFKDDRNVLL